MRNIFNPTSERDVADIVRDLKAPVAVRGSGTRSGLGRIVDAEHVLSTASLAGITLYEPAEMIMSVRAGTPVSLIERELKARHQMLPFEPMDHRILYGTDGEPTFGAVASCNISGPRRIQSGAARDSIVGIRFVNGRGEIIKSGGRVMKNVTGLDLVKLCCGSYGSLGVLTEITFKLLPRPERSSTWMLEGLDDRAGIAALTRAMASPFEVSGAALLPKSGAHASRTLLRVEGMTESVARRIQALRTLVGNGVSGRIMEGDDSADLWRDIRDGSAIASPRHNAIWRISLKPTDGPGFVSGLSGLGTVHHYYDWSGGLVWLSIPPGDDAGAGQIRQASAGKRGHATLVRAPDSVRRAAAVFEPLAASLMRITSGIKLSCDPRRMLNPGIMYPEI